jgi:diguanylate cyclase (GGDEF)-like protein
MSKKVAVNTHAVNPPSPAASWREPLVWLRGIEWQRRDVRDGLIIGLLSVCVFGIAATVDLFEIVHDFARQHDEWAIDELFLLSVVLAVAMAAFSYRRIRDLSREIHARRVAEQEAQTLARHDPLTGLPNRRYFAERCEDVLQNLNPSEQAAVLMMDLDGFKQINDLHGHASGDHALIQFAERIAPLLSNAVFARMGGDEFAVLLPIIASIEAPTVLARRIAAAMAEPFYANGAATTLGVGIGIAVAPDDGTQPEELVRRADLALYRAKAEGRSSIRFFEEEMDAHVERRIRIEHALRAALTRNEIVPHFQPLVSLEGDRLIGFEALARWDHPEFGALKPAVFIPIAEESGLITELGDQLLRRACLEAKSWPSHTILAFNISPLQLRDPTLGLRILSIVGQTGFDPRRLELEITETALVDNLELARQVVDELRGAGVRVALDDFGTGYATLSQLLSLHLDKIKIDRTFVERLGSDPESLVIVRAIIGLAHGFGLTTTAEGIEDNAQLEVLRANGCVEGQGYLFSRAIPAGELSAFIERMQGRRARQQLA